MELRSASELLIHILLHSEDCGHQYRYHKTNIASAAAAITAVATSRRQRSMGETRLCASFAFKVLQHFRQIAGAMKDPQDPRRNCIGAINHDVGKAAQ